MAEIMKQVLDALVCAHDKGIVHRDLKPHNIMISKLNSRNHVKVLDFGVGAFTHNFRSVDYKNLTVTQDILGTPLYSAPEQLRGEPPTIKSDLYAWGLLVIECLTGTPIMNGNSVAEVFQKQLSSTNVPIPSFILGHDLANILRRVLEKNQKNRAESSKDIYKQFDLINFNTLVGTIPKKEYQPKNLNELTERNNSFFSSNFSSRKQLTILCLKLSIENNKAINLEVQETIIKDQLNLCKDAAIRNGGYVSGTFLNNLIVYFGYPESNDTDARRAGRTALDLIHDIKKRGVLLNRQYGISLRIQIGLHTGTCLIQRNHLPEGNTASKAFDLAYEANYGNVLVSETSKKILSPFLEFEKFKTNQLKEKFEFDTYKLIGEKEAEAMSSLKPWSVNRKLIGRNKEKKNILTLWNKVDKKGHTILLCGQAGIGKSKLAHEIKKEVQSHNVNIKQCRCLPEQQNNALFPFFTMLKEYWEITNSNNTEKTVRKLKQILSDIGNLEKESLPILCSWLSIPLTSEYNINIIPPKEQKQLLFKILKECIIQINLKGRFLLVVEDLHWADPTTIDFIKFLTKDIDKHQCLLIITSRTPLDSSSVKHNLSQINLHTLSKENTQQLIKEILKHSSISDNLLSYTLGKSGGIPLFVEELTNMLLEEKHIQLKNDIYDIVSNIDEKIPATLNDLLNAKLDRLGLAKETAQLASCIGKEFSYDLLVSSSLKNEDTIQNDLTTLLESDLIYKHRRVQNEIYIFRHDLIKDAAYSSIIETKLTEYHLNIANSIENYFDDIKTETPFILAKHYGKAGMYDKALLYGIKKAKESLRKSLNQEAYNECIICLKWINKLAKNNQTLLYELEINRIIIPTLMILEGYGSESIANYSKRALQLEDILKNDKEFIEKENLIEFDHTGNWVLSQYHHMRSNRQEAKKIIKSMIAKSRKNYNRQNLVDSLPLLGLYYTTDGFPEKAAKHHEECLSLYNSEIDYELSYKNGIDPKCHAHSNYAFSLALLGKIEKSKDHLNQSEKWAKQIKHLPSMAITLVYKMQVAWLIRDRKWIQELHATNAIFFNKNPEINFLSEYSNVFNNWLVHDIASQENFSKVRLESKQTYLHSYLEGVLIDTLINNSQFEEALLKSHRAINWAENSGEMGFLSTLYFLTGVALYERDKIASQDVKNNFSRAIEIAKKQNTKTLENQVKNYIKINQL